ncbi:hypothetical protein CY35_17G009700 [Sphagnum magellanicum]|nr:hypothetical protein CY35_17G009700 [Sphagnum magellanicum]
MAAAASIATTASFVQRSGQQLFLDGAPFYDSTRPRMFAVMMAAAALGLTVCRTWAFNDATYQALQISPGNYDENALDQVIAVAQQNGVRLLLSLVNNWEDYGGKAQYVAWARKAGQDVSSADDFFTNPTCHQYYKDHVTAVLTRVNTFTQVQYCNDPTIFAWELMNEPKCQADPSGDTLQIGGPGTLAEFSQLSRDVDFAPGQVVSYLQQRSPGLGLIGRRSMTDLGAIGDNLIPALGGGNASGQHDQLFNSQALEAAYRKLPLPKDSERPKSYIPVNFLLSSALE